MASAAPRLVPPDYAASDTVQAACTCTADCAHKDANHTAELDWQREANNVVFRIGEG
jgi:hypothetical protein